VAIHDRKKLLAANGAMLRGYARGPGLAITHLKKQERDFLDSELEEGKVGCTTICQLGEGGLGYKSLADLA